MKTCKETKIFLRSWLGVWLVEEEIFISYVVYEADAQMLKCLVAAFPTSHDLVHQSPGRVTRG